MTLSSNLPQPWTGRTWCAVCAGRYKAAAADPAAPRPQLDHAVTRSVYGPLAHLGPLDLCWEHAMPLDPAAIPSQDGSVAA